MVVLVVTTLIYKLYTTLIFIRFRALPVLINIAIKLSAWYTLTNVNAHSLLYLNS